LVIENGQISEMGSHSELLSQRGHYYRLYTQQFRREMEREYNPFASVDAEGNASSESATVESPTTQLTPV
jgi:ATP-binding cassette subfamily B protein